MKKVINVWIVLVFVCVMCACQYDQKEEPCDKEMDTQETQSDDAAANAFFTGNSSTEYVIEYQGFERYELGKTVLDIEEIKDLEEGKLYVMNTEDKIPVERFPIYIYVKKDEIYRLWGTSEEVEKIENEEEVLEKSTIVFQQGNLPDQLGEDEEGWHHYITVEDDEVESHLFHYNDCANVTGYWESFTWKKGVGLTEYASGYAAGADLVKLQLNPEWSEEAKKAAAVYAGIIDFRYETDVPYVDEEIFELLKAAYADVSYYENYEKGDATLYDAYKEKFYRLINNEVTFLDNLTGEEFYIKDYGWIKGNSDWPNNDFKFYFFDMDGDDEPELCVKGTAFQYIFDYNAKQEQYTLWGPRQGSSVELGGTKKLLQSDEYEFFQLDGKGEVEYRTYFFEYSGAEPLYIVMYPEYEEKDERSEVPDEAKKQGVFVIDPGNWYFRVTKEQYEEFQKRYEDARWEAEKARGEVTYTYEELFGVDKIQEDEEVTENTEAEASYKDFTSYGSNINFIDERCFEMPEALETALSQALLDDQFTEFVSTYEAEYNILTDEEREEYISQHDSMDILKSYEKSTAVDEDLWFGFMDSPICIIRHPIGEGEYAYYEYLPAGVFEEIPGLLRALGKNEEYYFIQWEEKVYVITTKREEGKLIGIATYRMHGDAVYGGMIYQEKSENNSISTKYYCYAHDPKGYGTRWPEY